MKKGSTLVLTVILAILCSGCSSAWVKTLDTIISAAAPAVINILDIAAVANGGMMDSGLASKINADASAIKTLANDFGSASSSAAPGVCNQLTAEITVFQQDINLVLSTAQVKDQATQNKINLLTSLVTGTTETILAVIPNCKAASAESFKAAPPYSLRTFVQRYNVLLAAPTGNARVDALTSKRKLPEHNKFVRAITFGRLN